MRPRAIQLAGGAHDGQRIDAPVIVEAAVLVGLEQGEIDRIDVVDRGLEPPLAVGRGEGAQQAAVGVDDLGRARRGSARGWAGRSGRAPGPPSPGWWRRGPAPARRRRRFIAARSPYRGAIVTWPIAAAADRRAGRTCRRRSPPAGRSCPASRRARCRRRGSVVAVKLVGRIVPPASDRLRRPRSKAAKKRSSRASAMRVSGELRQEREVLHRVVVHHRFDLEAGRQQVEQRHLVVAAVRDCGRRSTRPAGRSGAALREIGRSCRRECRNCARRSRPFGGRGLRILRHAARRDLQPDRPLAVVASRACRARSRPASGLSTTGSLAALRCCAVDRVGELAAAALIARAASTSQACSCVVVWSILATIRSRTALATSASPSRPPASCRQRQQRGTVAQRPSRNSRWGRAGRCAGGPCAKASRARPGSPTWFSAAASCAQARPPMMSPPFVSWK